MYKAYSHPVHHQRSSACANFLEPCKVSVGSWFAEVRKIARDGEVGQLTQHGVVLAHREYFEIAEAYKRRCHPADNSAWFGLRIAVVEHVAYYFFTGQDQAQGPSSGYAKIIHRLAAQKFAQ